MNERDMVAMTARMDGTRSIAERIGRKQKVSDMELLALCNFARLGLLSMFSDLEGDIGDMAAAEMEDLKEAIQRKFGTDERPDGLAMLSECCAAILGGERLGEYVVPCGETED